MDEVATRDARRRVATELATDRRPAGHRYALVIGIDHYDPPLRRLYNAVKDATVIAGRLRDDFGFDVTLLTDGAATAAAIDDALGGWGDNTQPEDSILIFFAGHGANHPARDREKEGYLLPAGASDDPATWLPESEIVDRAKSLPARWVFLVFDACYAGTTFRADIPAGTRDDQVLKALVAGTEDQPVLDGGAGDHSIFTRAVLDGLDGWAEAGQQPDGVVTADELIAYVKSEVPWRSRVRGQEQTPVGGPLQGSRSGWDFEFIPIKPRLPAPLLRNIYSSSAEDRVAAAKQLGETAPADTTEVLQKKAAELIRLVRQDDELDVRMTATRALGRLGHPDGFDPLVDLVRSDTGDVELSAAAASALGDLAHRGSCRSDAIEVLIGAVSSGVSAVKEAAKLGLARIPESGAELLGALQDADSQGRRDVLDALACLADSHPDDRRAWPALSSPGDRALRRVYLTRRRLSPQWPAIRRQSLVVGLSGAIGLGLAYLILIFGLRPFNPYGPAVLSYNLLPGMLAGVSLALMPRLARGWARHPGRGATVVGGIAGGVILGLGLAVPNWFLGIGPPPAWFLPGIVSGSLLGLTLATWPSDPAEVDEPGVHSLAWALKTLRRHLVPLVVTSVVGGLGFALTRVPDSLAWGYVEPRWVEVLRWGYGGVIFAGVLAIGWSLSSNMAR